MSPSKQQSYELESILFDVKDDGYGVISITKLWRLLDKGSRAAGTWKALLDVWEELGNQRDDLFIFETSHQSIVLMCRKGDLKPPAEVMKWADEMK